MLIRKIHENLIGSSYLNRRLVFCCDLCLSLLATMFVVVILNFTTGFQFTPLIMLRLLLVALLASTVSFVSIKIYKGIIRYSAFTETGRIGLAVMLKLCIMTFLLGLFPAFLLSRVVAVCIVLDTVITFFLLTIVRSVLIFAYQQMLNMHKEDHMLIYRSADRGVSLPRKYYSDNSVSYRIHGYLHVEGNTNENIRVGGLTSYGIDSEKSFAQLVRRHNIKAILFPNQAAARREDDRIIRYCENLQVRMLLLPSINEIGEGRNPYANLPEVRIEDLLGREEININLSEIARGLSHKTVLVTGAAGSIGSELCRQLCSFGLKQLVMFDNAETPMHNIRLELEAHYPNICIHPIMGDVRLKERVEWLFRKYRPDLVFHAAAYKHVPLMEENPCESVHTNVCGTRHVADMALRFDAEKFIMVSTDKAVNPTNVMGASKRLAEIYIQSLGSALARGKQKGKTRFVTTRFGNVLGSNGSVIPRFREQLLQGGPLTVTHPDIIRYFMTIPEACRLVLEASFLGNGNDIFVFDMGEPVKIDDLARRMIRLSGLMPEVDVQIHYTGLRPGEKLYEELLSTKESHLATSNEKIYRAAVREYDYTDVARACSQLYQSAIQGDRIQTVRQMKQLVSEFVSKNSVYEKLDAEVNVIPKLVQQLA